MAGTIISGTVTTGVTLGSGTYSSPLTITSSGFVKSTAYAQYGGTKTVYVPSTITAVIANYGRIDGSGYLGIAVGFAGSGSLINHGTITGDYGGDGVTLSTAARLTNFGNIFGGALSINYGGSGVSGAALITNYGGITGGNGELGGVGVSTSGTLVNHGEILGGSVYGAQTAGTGVVASGTVINDARIEGGSGADDFAGGNGIDLRSGASLLNKGYIAGAYGSFFGGAGVEVEAGGTVTNRGTIQGGAGFHNIGSGVTINGGTLINSGVISGGLDGNSQFADAVQFGTAAATLGVEPGAAFHGKVIADATAHDALAVLGSSTTPLAGIGTEFLNFSTIEIGEHASGSIEGNIAGLAGGQSITGFHQHNTIILDGFRATIGTYVTGAGVELSNGKTTVILDITGAFSPGELRGSSSDAGTTISLADTAPINLGTDLSSFTFVAATEMKAEQHNPVSAWLHPIDFSPATSFQGSVETKPPSGPHAGAGLLLNPFGGTEVAGLLAHQIPWLHAG